MEPTRTLTDEEIIYEIQRLIITRTLSPRFTPTGRVKRLPTPASTVLPLEGFVRLPTVLSVGNNILDESHGREDDGPDGKGVAK